MRFEEMPRRSRKVHYDEDEEVFLTYSHRDTPESVKQETGYKLATIVEVPLSSPQIVLHSCTHVLHV